MAQKAGFLTKEGGSIKTWKKRWCVLKNGTLSYSKNQVSSSSVSSLCVPQSLTVTQQSSSDLGCIQLEQARDIKVASQRKKKNCLSIETPARTYFMCAENADSRDEWVRELTAERDRIQGKAAKSPTEMVRKPTGCHHQTATSENSLSDPTFLFPHRLPRIIAILWHQKKR